MSRRSTEYLHEYDARHFAFTRDSRLPRDTFAERAQRTSEWLLGWTMLGIGIVVVLGLIFGWWA